MRVRPEEEPRARAGGEHDAVRDRRRRRSPFWVALTVICVLALTLRLVRPTADPPVGLSWSDGIFTDGPTTVSAARIKMLNGYWGIGLNWFPVLSAATFTSYKLLGLGLAQARLPFMLVGSACILLLGLLLRREAGARAGLIGALLLAVSYLFAMYNRLTLSETFLSFFMLASLYLWHRSREREVYLFLSGVALAAGILLVKLHGLYLLPAVLVGIWLRPPSSSKSVVRPLAVFCGGVLCVAVAWYLLLYSPQRVLFAEYLRDNVLKLPGDPLGKTSPAFLLRKLVTLGVKSKIFARAPLVSLLALSCVLHLLGDLRNRARARPLATLFALWLVCGYVLLALVNYRPPRYQVPLAPALCALAALALDRLWAGLSVGEKRPWLRRRSALLVSLGVLLVCYQTGYQLHELFGPATVEGAQPGRVRESIHGPLLAVSAGVAVLAAALLFAARRRVRQAVRAVARHSRPIAVSLLSAMVGIGLGQYYRWLAAPHYTVYHASKEIGLILSGGAVVAGPHAEAIGLENRVGTQCLFALGLPMRERYLEERDPPVTHFLFPKKDIRLVQEHVPHVWQRAQPVRTCRIGRETLELVRIADPDGPYRPSRFEMARQHQADHLLSDAITEYESFLSAHPGHAASLANIGLCYLAAGNEPKAAAYFRDAFARRGTDESIAQMVPERYWR